MQCQQLLRAQRNPQRICIMGNSGARAKLSEVAVSTQLVYNSNPLSLYFWRVFLLNSVCGQSAVVVFDTSDNMIKLLTRMKAKNMICMCRSPFTKL